jgi:sporulation protein YlmC with PRC-barrel domain
MPEGGVYYAGLHLLDHQMVDRDRRDCGKVDDLELEERDGRLRVVALVAGPGVLLRRFGRRRLGTWLERFVAKDPDNADQPAVIPFTKVSDIASRIVLAVAAQDLATERTERWVRDHVIAHVPGSNQRAAE